MARGRMISKSLSTSSKYAALYSVAGALAEFCQSLYPLLVAHSDDYGRQAGDAFTVKHLVCPASPRTLQEVESALQALTQVQLIHRYPAGNCKPCIQIVAFDPHQTGLKGRVASVFPPPPLDGPEASPLSASESEIEARLFADLLSGSLRVGDYTVATADRQVRVGNSYIDILARTTDGATLVIEVKRQRVTHKAVAQVLGYVAALGADDAVPIVIGHGLAAGFTSNGEVVVGEYGDDVLVRSAASFTGKGRHITVSHVKSNRTELNGREENSEQKIKAAAAPQTPTAPPKPQRDKPEDNYRQILAIVHKEILPTGVSDIGDLEEATKSRCAKLRIAYNSEVVRKAVESALAARKARRA